MSDDGGPATVESHELSPDRNANTTVVFGNRQAGLGCLAVLLEKNGIVYGTGQRSLERQVSS